MQRALPVLDFRSIFYSCVVFSTSSSIWPVPNRIHIVYSSSSWLHTLLSLFLCTAHKTLPFLSTTILCHCAQHNISFGLKYPNWADARIDICFSGLPPQLLFWCHSLIIAEELVVSVVVSGWRRVSLSNQMFAAFPPCLVCTMKTY